MFSNKEEKGLYSQHTFYIKESYVLHEVCKEISSVSLLYSSKEKFWSYLLNRKSLTSTLVLLLVINSDQVKKKTVQIILILPSRFKIPWMFM